MVSIRRATVADAVRVAPRLRPEDRAECIAALGMPPEFVLPRNVAGGEDVWVAESDQGDIVGIFGVSSVACHPYFGIVWLAATPAIKDHQRDLIRLAPKWLAKLHAKYPLIGNHADARNTVHIRWLRRMGFSILRTMPEFGVERRPFLEFARLRTEPACAQQS